MKYIQIIFITVLVLLQSCTKKVISEHYPNGTLSAEYEVVDGKKNGYYKAYYANGNSNYTAFYKNDSLHGKKINYNRDGSFEWEMEYNNGKEHGLYRRIDEEGYKWETRYANGEISGAFKIFYPSGKIRALLNYISGQQEGEFKYFYENGALSQVGYMIHDSLICYNNYKKDGELNGFKASLQIRPQKDTITLGETYKAKILVHMTLEKDNVYFITVSKTLDTKPEQFVEYFEKDRVINFEYKPTQKGKFYIIAVGHWVSTHGVSEIEKVRTLIVK